MSRYLFLFDFDNTLAQSFKASPSSVSVDTATRGALYEMLGEEGLVRYESIGGHANRSPAELIEAMGLKDDDVGAFVEHKMKIYRPELEKGWPEAFAGVTEMLKKIEKINIQGNVHIDIGVLSAGHTEFIEKTFENWGVRQPDILITDDDIRELKNPKEKERRMKPAAFLFAYAHYKWLRLLDVTVHTFELPFAREARDRVLYFGDDPVRDGKLAEVAHVQFAFFDRTGENANEVHDDTIYFSYWGEISEKLLGKKALEKMQRGEYMKKITREVFAYPEQGAPTMSEVKMK